MTRKRKPKHPEVSALRSPPQARTGLAKWSLVVDQTPDDQATQVEMTPRLGTAQASIQDCLPAPPRQRTPDDRDPENADVRDGELDGRPLLDGLHAKNAGQRPVVRRGPEDKVRPAARIGRVAGLVSPSEQAVNSATDHFPFGPRHGVGETLEVGLHRPELRQGPGQRAPIACSLAHATARRVSWIPFWSSLWPAQRAPSVHKSRPRPAAVPRPW